MVKNKLNMKILLITPTFSPDVGGVETMLVNLCDHFAKRKFYVNLITYSPLIVRTKAPFKERLNNYVTVWRIPWVGFGLFNIFERIPPIQFLYLVPGLLIGTLFFLSVSKWRPDIIHVFGLSGAFVGGVVSRIYKIPCVVDMCTVYRLPKRQILAWFVRKILNWCDYIRGNHPPGKAEIIKIGINPKKVGIITPPVDESVFKPMLQTKVRLRLGLSQKNFIALFVGRMVRGKDVDIAVAVTRLIKNPNIAFVFIGEGPLQYLVENVALNDKRVIFIGNVKHWELPYYYNAADVLICTAVDSNIISYVGREALMCGLPILAFNVTRYFNIPRRVKPNLLPLKVGRLLNPTPKALAACLNELIYQRENKGVLSFDRQICSKFAFDNYSQRAMDWLGDSYEKAVKIRFMNEG